ncbi:PREDICTED: pentatricopeptide repeat-containing protein At3g13160, mitochondrial [Camelina sativa]|uniref:Pentatricopeptide repeat-containing protein At3g13160, mitochondrial n=1 Tax=Camelina sativa TaxID=90675 RepID=A0ABM0YFC0_CAMSA|nr:PREDICTED: pentatricopeptide repeat-containing protein At3g13160, mitochondrial [Camelina sativa]
MSSLSRFLLRSTFSFSTPTNRRFFSAVTAAATTASPSKPSSLITLVNDERDPKFITEKFKKACQVEWFRKNIAVYERTVRRLAAAKKFEWIEEILEEQNKYPNMSKEGFVARIINLYGRVGMFENAQKVFDEMPERNCKRTVLSFNALLNACVNSKKFDLVEELFKELPGKLSIEPDVASYNTLIKGLCGKGSFTEAVALIDEIENKGLKPDHITFNILLHESYTKGKIQEGEKIWARMGEKNVKRDVRSYNARLLGLATEMKSDEMVNLFDELKVNGIKPDVFTFTAMIKGSVSEGKLDEAITWYKEIEKNGLRPMKFIFTSLLPAMCKAGDLESAYELCKEIFSKRFLVDGAILQEVVDELVKGSKQDEAEKIVELAKTNDYLQCKLRLSSEE